jgi:hypothetical protein
MVLMIYSLGLCLLLFISGESFIVQNYNDAKRHFQPFNQCVSVQQYLQALGRTWWWQLIPVEDTATELAWPGVDWSHRDSHPL